MTRLSLPLLLAGAVVALSGCSYWKPTGPAASGISSSSPAAVESAAGGHTGGGANSFTPAQITPGTPAGANLQP